MPISNSNSLTGEDNDGFITIGPISNPGQYGYVSIWTSPQVNSATATSLDLIVRYKNAFPYSDADENPKGPNNIAPLSTQYSILAVLESQEIPGLWLPFHSQGLAYTWHGNNPGVFKMSVSPDYSSGEPGTVYQDDFLTESPKQMNMPDNFRVAIHVRDGAVEAERRLTSLDLSLLYRLYSI